MKVADTQRRQWAMEKTRSGVYLPTVPLVGEKESWETFVDLITRRLMPQLDAAGTRIFYPIARPIPPDASIVPIRDIWVRSKPFSVRLPVLGYVVEGQGEMFLDNKWLSLPAGQGVFLPPNAPRAPHVMRGGKVVPSDWLWFLVYPFGVHVHRCRLTPTAHQRSICYFVSERTLSDLFHEWTQKQNLPDALRDKGLLLAFFGLLKEATPLPINPMEQLPEQFASLPLPLQRAVQLLHCSYDKPFQLAQLAERCFVSRYHLCWLFRQKLGMTPLGYLTRLRLTIASQLLQGTDLSVTEVAQLVGYPNLRHFQRLFIRHYGVSPSHFRSSQRTKSPRLVLLPPEAE